MIAVSILMLALALAMDAFAVAVAQGAARRLPLGEAVRIALAFGVAQGVMPLLGWGLGIGFAGMVAAVDHWIALLLLGFLGLRMAKEGIWGESDAAPRRLTGYALFAAAIATSIDAAIAGVTLPAMQVPVAITCIAIGIVTAVLSFAGACLGAAIGNRFGRLAEVCGGIMLIGLGIRIFVDHTYLAG